MDKGEAAPVGSALKALEAAAERANGAGADERKVDRAQKASSIFIAFITTHFRV